MTEEAFVTGSRKYGSPRPDSDVDLAILVNREDAEILRHHSEGEGEEANRKIVYGKLNLIVFVKGEEDDQYQAWKKTNEVLRAMRPVTKAQATSALENMGAHGNFSGSGD